MRLSPSLPRLRRLVTSGLRSGQASRFARLSRNRARLALLAIALILAACLTALTAAPPATDGMAGASDRMTDLDLYERIVAGMKGGEGYYVAAADAMRVGGWPLRPFLTMRLPTLAALQAALPGWGVAALLVLLASATALAWALRIGRAAPRTLPRLALVLLLAASLPAYFQPGLTGFHEIWAGLLVALSLALRRPGRWIEAVAIGLAAMLIRETAALYVFLMAGFAWAEGQRREAAGWLAAIALFAIALACHAHAVSAVTGPLDLRAPGWVALNGIGFFVRALVLETALQALPLWLAALLVGLALIGWASWDDALGLRMLALLLGYAVAIALFAPTDDFYWVLMVAPVSLVGLLFVPDALRDLCTRALDRRRITVTRVVQ